MDNKLNIELKLNSVYRNNRLPGKKQFNFSIKYNAQNRTLTNNEVNKIHKEIMDDLLLKIKDSKIIGYKYSKG